MTPDAAAIPPDAETQWRTQTYVTGAPQLTARAVVVGMLLGMVFGASSLYLVLKVGLTVSASIPVAVISDRKKVLRSWDGFEIPKPLSRVIFVYGEPLSVPAELDSPGVERHRHALEWHVREQLAELRCVHARRARVAIRIG